MMYTTSNTGSGAPIAQGAQTKNHHITSSGGLIHNHSYYSCQALAEKIFQNLGGRQLGNGEWMCHCPSHDDRNPSLHLTLQDGKVLFHCMAGCSQDDVLSPSLSKF